MDNAAQRSALAALIAQSGESYAALSRLIGRNDAYLQQFVTRGSPRELAERDRALLARYFGVAEARLGGPELPGLVPIVRLDVGGSAGAGGIGGGEGRGGAGGGGAGGNRGTRGAAAAGRARSRGAAAIGGAAGSRLDDPGRGRVDAADPRRWRRDPGRPRPPPARGATGALCAAVRRGCDGQAAAGARGRSRDRQR